MVQTNYVLYTIIMMIIYLLTPSISHAKFKEPHGINLNDDYLKKQRCGQDRFEPNNLRSRARNLTAELKNSREVTAKLCGEDKDWYTVWLNRGELVEFEVYSALDEPPFINVYAPRKRKLSGIIKKLSPSSRILKLYAKKSGRYRIKLFSSRKAQSSYTLTMHRPIYH